MKKLLLVAAVAATFTGGVAFADEAAPAAAPVPDNVVAFNVGVVSDYRYRGISQSRLQAAVQGGADYTNNPTGFYLGTWLSSIKWTKDAGGSGNGNVEVDIYGGKRGDFGTAIPGVSYDVGVLSYVYPKNGLGSVPGFANANTTEVYGQLGYGVAYAKYSYSVTNLFGFVDSKKSGYLDLGANLDLTQGYTLGLHAGYQHIAKNTAYSYVDWKAGVTKEYFSDSFPVTFGLALIGTNQTDVNYYYTPAGKFTGRTSFVLSALKTF